MLFTGYQGARVTCIMEVYVDGMEIPLQIITESKRIYLIFGERWQPFEDFRLKLLL